MKVRTVRGEIRPEDLGVTLTHEHLLIDVTCRWRRPTESYLQSISERSVELEIIGDLRRNPTISKDSLKLTDHKLAIEELRLFKELGGRSLVDQTSSWIGRDHNKLREISQALDLNIITTTSYYSPILPRDIENKTIDGLAEALITEWKYGIEGSGIYPGIIGEVGTSWPLTANEEKTLRAAARAQLQTGGALSIHPSPWDPVALKLLDIVASEGVSLSRVLMCHLDHFIDLEYLSKIAQRGAFVEFDRFGVEWYRSQIVSLQSFPRDTERVAALIELMKLGYASQLLISHDVCQKVELKKYGGHGYAHILRYVVPMMRKMGVSDSSINELLVDNPKNLLSIA